jgi:hypothetical protein
MSLWCSLLGHRFEGPEVEREREERGEEVVTVSREVETCGRCGERRVVSENTEVRTVDPAPDDLEDEPPASDHDEGPDAGGFGGVVERSEAVDRESATDTPGVVEETPDPTDEDAEILTEASSSGEREPGEWPSEPGSEDDPARPGTENDGSPDRPRTEPPGDGEFYCPDCGFTADRKGSALREGDACPECMGGYLETR